MELISVLSTIILFITAATTILAIGAYILYKVREHSLSKRPNMHAKVEAISTEHLLVLSANPLHTSSARQPPHVSLEAEMAHSSVDLNPSQQTISGNGAGSTPGPVGPSFHGAPAWEHTSILPAGEHP